MSQQGNQQEIVVVDDTTDSDVEFIETKNDADCVIVFEKIKPITSSRVHSRGTKTKTNNRPQNLQNVNQINTAPPQIIGLSAAPPSPPSLKTSCCVCLEDPTAVKDKFFSTICGHIYCDCCIDKIMQTSKMCAICRKKITKRSYHRIFFG